MLTPEKTGRRWVLVMTPEMAKDADVAEGSLVVIYLRDGSASAEILPPATEGMKRVVGESADEFRDVFAELKRLGDSRRGITSTSTGDSSRHRCV